MRELVETACQLVANMQTPCSGVTAPYGRIDDAGRVIFSEEVNQAVERKPCQPSGIGNGSGRQIRKLPPKNNPNYPG